MDATREPALKSRFSVTRYPKLLYWDAGFPQGVPRQYYRSYGLTADGLLLWLRKQIMSAVGGPSITLCFIFLTMIF